MERCSECRKDGANIGGVWYCQNVDCELFGTELLPPSSGALVASERMGVSSPTAGRHHQQDREIL